MSGRPKGIQCLNFDTPFLEIRRRRAIQKIWLVSGEEIRVTRRRKIQGMRRQRTLIFDIGLVGEYLLFEGLWQ